MNNPKTKLLQIETARLCMRPFTIDDVDALHRLWTDPQVRKYLCGLARIYAGADSPNAASFRVMEKCGMAFAKRLRINDLEAIYYVFSQEAFQLDEVFPFALTTTTTTHF